MHYLTALALTSSLLAQTASPPRAKKPPIQGITISTHRSGQDWGTDRIDACLDDVKTVGANWVSIHPYARIHGSGRVTWRSWSGDKPPAELTRPIEQAHRRGLKIFIKPHLAHWGSPFKWRGEIAFDSAAKWQRFFKNYTRWIVAVARACPKADGFCIGTELDKTLHKKAEWAAIVQAVRGVSKSPLTYAANWTDYQRVPFWKQLDIIGIQAYFPLTDDRNAKRAELEVGWKKIMNQLRAFATRQGKNIVFTELGYNTAHDTAIRPWESRSDGAAAAAIQQLCTTIALRAVANEPRVEGAFLWKWFPPPRPVGRNFPLATPGMKQAIRRVWQPSKSRR